MFSGRHRAMSFSRGLSTILLSMVAHCPLYMAMVFTVGETDGSASLNYSCVELFPSGFFKSSKKNAFDPPNKTIIDILVGYPLHFLHDVIGCRTCYFLTVAWSEIPSDPLSKICPAQPKCADNYHDITYHDKTPLTATCGFIHHIRHVVEIMLIVDMLCTVT